MPRVRRKSAVHLRIPQLRALAALAGGASLSRAELGAACGFTELSGSITRVLNGIREGSSSGAAHPGLLTLKLIEEVEVDVDGAKETLYRITEAGLRAVADAGPLPPLRDRDASTNERYKIG